MARSTVSPLIKAQIEKLTIAGANSITLVRRPIYSSSPTIIPKDPAHSNALLQISSSYTSIGDQMSSSGEKETFFQTERESNDESNNWLPTLFPVSQRLEHSAARDRIHLKTKRRQPTRHHSNSHRDFYNSNPDLFSTVINNEQDDSSTQTQFKSHLETLIVKQPNISLKPAHIPSRDHSADKMTATKSSHFTNNSSVQRSVSFNRPQDVQNAKSHLRQISNIKKIEEDEEEQQRRAGCISPIESSLSTKPKEHIYDNLNLFARHQIQKKDDNVSYDDESVSTNSDVRTREPLVSARNRLRPFTIHVPDTRDEQKFNNDFGNTISHVKRSDMLKTIPKKSNEILQEEPSDDEMNSSTSSSISHDDGTSKIAKPNIEKKQVGMSDSSRPTVRRKTVGGVHLPPQNNTAIDNNKPTASWIDIAKEKQNRFRLDSIEKDDHEQFQSTTNTVLSSRSSMVKDNAIDNEYSEEKPIILPTVSRRRTPPVSSTNSQRAERDSVRALRCGEPGRLNNLIKLFNK